LHFITSLNNRLQSKDNDFLLLSSFKLETASLLRPCGYLRENIYN